MIDPKLKSFFTRQIIEFSNQINRDLPWKGTNPYHIWLSEIILQQTRVEQGRPYYLKFIARFPTLKSLALAHEDEVLKAWQGLGYYTRARNLHATAKEVHFKLKGRFPRTKQELKKLKGIGEYTSAAIASFAFNQPAAVLDGNVYRVLSRFLGSEETLFSAQGKAYYQHQAQQLIDVDRPGVYNQAIMDLGALICKPKSPDCPQCPLQEHCTAFMLNRVPDFPIPKPKIVKKKRYFHYLVIIDQAQRVLVRKRTDRDIWKGLFEFPYFEKNGPTNWTLKNIREHLVQEYQLFNPVTIEKPKPYQQTLSHQKITGYFHQVFIEDHKPADPPRAIVNIKNLSNLAFPKIIDWYLRDNYINLYI